MGKSMVLRHDRSLTTINNCCRLHCWHPVLPTFPLPFLSVVQTYIPICPSTLSPILSLSLFILVSFYFVRDPFAIEYYCQRVNSAGLIRMTHIDSMQLYSSFATCYRKLWPVLVADTTSRVYETTVTSFLIACNTAIQTWSNSAALLFHSSGHSLSTIV